MKTMQAVQGELIIPISKSAAEAVENVGQVLLAGELTPEQLTPRERLFRTAILAINRHFTAMDDELLTRLTQLAAIKRPRRLWEIVDLMIQSDDERHSRTGRWEPSQN